MSRRALSIGCGIDLARPRSGVVHSVFERAVNLLVDGEMWTVLAASQADVPFGIRLAAEVDGLALTVGDCVHARSGFVGAGKEVIDLRTASRWSAVRWTPPVAGWEKRLAVMEQAALPLAWSDSVAMAGDVTAALGRTDSALEASLRRTIGRGPGLTPSGDDVLVGILALLTSGAAGAAGSHAAARLASAMESLLPSTTDLSRHLLQQTARGLPGRGLHDLGRAVIESAADEIFAESLTLVLDTGATSGADACMGFVAACRTIFLNPAVATA